MKLSYSKIRFFAIALLVIFFVHRITQPKFKEQQIKSVKITINFNDFKFDNSAQDRLRAHVIDLPSKSEIVSAYGELIETFRNDSDGITGPLYLTIKSNSNQCDPLDPKPIPIGSGKLPWDFSDPNNFRNDSTLKTPTLLARNILCDYDSSLSSFISFQKPQETGGFMKGSMNVYLNYISLDD